jgi:hypothetical protein
MILLIPQNLEWSGIRSVGRAGRKIKVERGFVVAESAAIAEKELAKLPRQPALFAASFAHEPRY